MYHYFLFILIFCTIFILNVLFFILFFFSHPLPIEGSNVIVKKTNLTHQVFIAVMTTSDHQKEMVILKQLLLPKFTQANYFHSMIFYGDSPLNFDQYHEDNFPFVSVQTKNDFSRHFLCAKIKESLKHFLFETTASWYIRICGDTYVNVNNFPYFLSEINQSRNPFFDTLIQGACLGKEQLIYIQGGSGFVFSRKAAFDLYNDWDFFSNACTEYKNDDRALAVYLDRINFSFYDASSRWFVGHRFFGFKSAYSAIVNASLHNIKRSKCGKVPVSRKKCRAYYTRINQIVFWHDKTPFDNFIGKMDIILNYSTNNLYFYVPNNKPMICIANSEIQPGYYP